MTEIDPAAGSLSAPAEPAAGTVVAHGEVPFVLLPDGRTIMAKFRVIHRPQPRWSLSDPESTHWALALDGREFAVTGPVDGRPGWLPISNSWARGGNPPHPALPEDDRLVARYDYVYLHHLGSVSGEVTLVFDVPAMTVTVTDVSTFDAD
jgi:hypothetical protein